ncbi:MAG: restriction endonuclease subunit S [Candidatus Gracilibacteria bacterium]|nr:restriction endonuclease subunit S [Candidatus Gracilibacteria bacterium]
MSQGQLERFDVEAYKNKKVLNSKYDLVKIGDIASLKAGGTPRRGIDDFWKNGTINWLKSGELKDSLNITNIEEKITDEGLKKSSATLFEKGTLLIAMYGATAGEVGILGIESSTNQAVCSIIPKIEVNKNYLFWILFLLRKKIKSETFGGAQPNISKDYLENLKIPLPPLEIQNQIVEKMDFALNEKKRKESEAKTLLESIDDFVLTELGIEYKEVEEKKIFAISLNEVIEEFRFDPLNFQKKDKHIEKTKYKIGKLSEFANVTKGQSISSDNIIKGDIPVIAGGQTSPYNHNISNYNGNIITISASGAYSGYVWYHTYPIFASDCNVIFSKDEKILKTEFLSYFLKARQKYIYSMQQGAGQPHVYSRDIEELEIPLPPLEIQEKIALEVKSKIEKANVLESEAKEVYDKAKREVEEIILD